MQVSRRSFLKLAGAATAATAFGMKANNLFALEPTHLEQKAGTESTVEKKFEGYDVKYTSDIFCPSECGLEVWTKDGKIEKIYGNYADPYNHGKMCGKGPNGCQLVYSPERLKYPLIRVGERGEGKFKRVSWDDATDYLAKRLIDIKKKYGAESVIMDTGDVTDNPPYYRLFFAYGTPHVFEHGSICDTPRRFGPNVTIGGKRWEPDVMRPVLVRQKDGSLKEMGYDDLPLPKYIMYVGWNPFVATRIQYEMRGTVTAQIKGAKIITVDPALSNTAAKSDIWLPIRPSADAHLLAAIFRYILENNAVDQAYVDKYTAGWDDFVSAFKSYWGKTDPTNGLEYFTMDWAVEKTELSKEQILEVAEIIATEHPGAVVWSMNGTGHRWNGYISSALGVAINVARGNFEAPGGIIDCNQVRISKGGKGKGFRKRKVVRTVNGKKVEAHSTEELHMDLFGKWPAGWYDVVGDIPDRILNGVHLKYGPFAGYSYPIKGYLASTGNAVISGSATWKWKEALTAKDEKGDYKCELTAFIDALYLETGMYADVILPEASYMEHVGIADIYPSCAVAVLRDKVIEPLYESKTQVGIMNAIAKALARNGDTDIKGSDFWEKYKTDFEFWDTAIDKKAPGVKNVGDPLPYPNLPEGYKLIGTPDSLEAGDVTIDDENKVVKGTPVTCQYLKDHQGCAVWPMSWNRQKQAVKTKSGKIEFKWTKLEKINKKIAETGVLPPSFEKMGWKEFPTTFFWYEAAYNPTNPEYRGMAKEYPFHVVSCRIHNAMTGTWLTPNISEMYTEGVWAPLNMEFEHKIADWETERNDGSTMPQGKIVAKTKRFQRGTFNVGCLSMNSKDAADYGVKTGDLATIETPLGIQVKGVVLVCETLKPGVLRMPFAGGGRFSPGMGPVYKARDYTINHNEITDPELLSPILGQPCYEDMLVKIVKVETPAFATH